MAFGNSTFQDIGGAVSDLFAAQGARLKGKGDLLEATNYDLAANLARQNEEFTRQSTEVKQLQTQRQIYLGLGQTEADVAGSGFEMSGSGLDILRAGAAQGALTKQIVGQQGLITEAGYEEQAQAFKNMSSAAILAADAENRAARGAQISAIIKGVAAVGTLFTGGLPTGGGGDGGASMLANMPTDL